MGSPFRIRADGVVGVVGGMIADEAEVRRAVELFADNEHGCEIVSLPSGVHRTIKGSFVDGVIEAIKELPSGSGIYFRFNPSPMGLGRQAKKADTIYRKWIYLDIDPVKSKEHLDNSATDEEKGRAAFVCDSVVEYLSSLGWPAPVVCDSGNGFNLFYRCEFNNDAAVQKVYTTLLQHLSEKFSGENAKIDKAIHNANRLAKVPGTWAKKGTQFEDRPYRAAKIISIPPQIQPVTFEQFSSVALSAEPVGETRTLPSPTPSASKTEAYGKAALNSECESILTAQASGEGRNNALNTAAFNLGQLVAGGVLNRNEVEARLRDAAVDSGLDRDPECGERGIQATIASGMSAGLTEPRGVPESKQDPKGFIGKKKSEPTVQESPDNWSVEIDGEVVVDAPPADFLEFGSNANQSENTRAFELYTLKGLMAAQFPEPTWVIPGMLSEGLNLLAGKPKMGKSMMALNMAMTVAAGGMALGNIQTSPGDVLYLSLEDRTRRLQSRARKMLKGINCEASSRLTIAAHWPRQGQGGLEMIEWWIKRVAKPTLVIIDVWGKFRPPGNPKANAYTQDYEHMTPLKNMMDQYSCCGLGLMHCRKGASEDVVEDVSGTLGIAGSADGIIVLQRSRNDNEAKIFITGRDVADTELSLRFDPESLVWTNLGSAEEHVTGKLQVAILSYLKSLNGSSAFTPDIAAHINEQPDKIRPVLHRLFDKKLIRHVGKSWAFPGDEEPPSEMNRADIWN